MTFKPLMYLEMPEYLAHIYWLFRNEFHPECPLDSFFWCSSGLRIWRWWMLEYINFVEITRWRCGFNHSWVFVKRLLKRKKYTICIQMYNLYGSTEYIYYINFSNDSIFINISLTSNKISTLHLHISGVISLYIYL